MTPSEIKQKFENDLKYYIADKIRLLEEETKLRVESVEVDIVSYRPLKGERRMVVNDVSIQLVA